MIYFAQGMESQKIKIGYTSNLAERLASITRKAGESLSLLGTVKGDVAHERAIHETLSAHRLHGEWFAPHEDVLQFIPLAQKFVSGLSVEEMTTNLKMPVTLRKRLLRHAIQDGRTLKPQILILVAEALDRREGKNGN